MVPQRPKRDVVVSFFCPACGQQNETSIKKVLVIETGTEYIGTGEYVGSLESVGLYCSGCRVTSEVDMEA